MYRFRGGVRLSKAWSYRIDNEVIATFSTNFGLFALVYGIPVYYSPDTLKIFLISLVGFHFSPHFDFGKSKIKFK